MRPGLSEAEFRRLFAKCRCGLVMTRRVFRMHICITGVTTAQNPPVVIDLTDDSNESESVSSGPSNHIIDLTADSGDEQQ